jgi:type I restriction enzyme M protein
LNAQGVKANVLFFDRKPGAKEPWTKKVWIYDLRTNNHFTLKTKRMARADLEGFVGCYKPGELQKRKATWSEIERLPEDGMKYIAACDPAGA